MCSALALGDIDKHKRILLNNDQDFVAEFVKLQATVLDLQTENQQLKNKQQQIEKKQLQLESAIDQLKIATNGRFAYRSNITCNVFFNTICFKYI